MVVAFFQPYCSYTQPLPTIMKKIILTSILIFIFNSVFSQNLIDEKYYFVNGNELFGIKISNDSIFELKCNSDFQCAVRKRFKILKNKKIGQKQIFAIERLDSMRLTSNPIPKDRYRIIGFEKIEKGKLKFVNEAKSYTLDSLSKIPFEIQFINDKFGFTYYTESFLTELETDYTINAEQLEKITSNFENYIELLELYENTKTGDMYAIGIIAELIAKEMIKLKLSPLLARNRIEEALEK